MELNDYGKYLKSLSDSLVYKFEAQQKLSLEILKAKSTVLGMQLEMSLYKLKSGENDKYKKSKDRIDFLESFLNEIGNLDSNNEQMQLLLQNCHTENNMLKRYITSLEKRINQLEEEKKFSIE